MDFLKVLSPRGPMPLTMLAEAAVLDGWEPSSDQRPWGSVRVGIADCMTAKATSTLQTRANHLLRFIVWTERQEVIALPLSEPAVHHYFVLCAASAAAAFGVFCRLWDSRSLLSSSDPVLLSGTVRGLAAKAYMEKRPLRQRDPLRVSEVEIVVDEARREAGPHCQRIFPLLDIRKSSLQ